MNRRELLASGASLAAVALVPGARARTSSREWRPPQFHAARHFLETRLGRIAYVERGRGLAALFLHGWPLNGLQWRGAMARLQDVRRCVAADFMGLGYSEVPEAADLSPLRQVEMLIALLDGLDIDRADVVSNDSGTGVALLLAALHPARVRSLLITNGDVHTNSPPPLLEPVLQDARQGRLVEFFDRQLADNRIAQSDQGLGIVYTHPSNLTPELVETYLRPLVTGAKRRRQGQQYGVAMLPNPLPAIEPRLRASPIPARMVWGTADPLFPTPWAQWLDEALPQSRGIRFVQGAKLFFPEEYPEIIATEARTLWNITARQRGEG